tara:strand:- start:1821 stop:2420 length:600 start_codon:yes stop_codon:yes gene_type:complete
MKFIKRGAMFGLDARIALAIFGALSVISGAALYSAIQQSKVVAMVTEVSEIEKSLEALILDVGVNMPVYNARDTRVKNLIANVDSLDGWNGPYASYNAITGQNHHIEHPAYDYIGLLKMKNDWGSSYDYSTADWTDFDCTADCSYFISLGNKTDGATPHPFEYSFFSNIDEYVDGSVDAGKGKIRYKDGYLLVKSIPWL